MQQPIAIDSRITPPPQNALSPAPGAAPTPGHTIHSKTNYKTLKEVAEKTNQTMVRLQSGLKKARQAGRKSIIITYEETGLVYIITSEKRYFTLTVGYMENCPVCHVDFNSGYKQFSKQYNCIYEAASNLEKELKRTLIKTYGIPAYIDIRHSNNPNGIRLSVVGADSENIARGLISIARSFQAAGMEVDIQLVDHQRGLA